MGIAIWRSSNCTNHITYDTAWCVCVCVCVGGPFALVMSIVGDYPMLINARAPSLRLYLNFEQCRETKAYIFKFWIDKFKSEVLKTLKCATPHWRSIFIRARQMPNKSANQIHTVLISAHFSSISEIYCSQISVVSWIRVLFLSAVCSSFDRVSTFSWASPRNFTCKMLMRWSAHLPKRGVTECVTHTNWFYWLVITLITFFLLVTIFVTMFINVYLLIYYSWNPTL